MNRARNFAEFKAALSQLALIGSNTIYADRAGNIFYVHGNAIPRRDPKFDWTKPVDGDKTETEWQGYHALDELPQLFNPKSGFLQNCNSTPFLTTSEGNPRKEDFPQYLTPEEDTPRAKSSRRILTEKEKFTFDEWTRAATDTKVYRFYMAIEVLMAQWEKMKNEEGTRAEKLEPVLRELKTWDGTAKTDSIATTLYLLYLELTNSRMPSVKFADLWALEKAVAELELKFGAWRVPWGEINRLQRVHTSGDEPFSDERQSWPVVGGPGAAGLVHLPALEAHAAVFQAQTTEPDKLRAAGLLRGTDRRR